MSNHASDHELPDSYFTSDFGIGLQFIDDRGNVGLSVAHQGDRTVRLELGSFVGISPGAMHWYASLKFYSLNWKVLKKAGKDSLFPDTKKGDVVCIGGYIDKFKPPQMLSYTIEITRKVTRADRKIDEGERFKFQRVGEPTNCFNTRPEAKAAALKVFDRLFAKNGWKLELED